MEKAGTGKSFERALSAVMEFLDSSGRPSAIIGAVAVVARGFSRFTADIDGSMAAELEDIPKLLRLAKKSGLSPRIADAAQFAEENRVMLLQHDSTDTPVDISLASQGFELEAFQSAERFRFGSVTIRVPSLAALLIYKMVAARPKDIIDVEALLATRASFDVDLVERTLREFDALLDLDRTSQFKALVRAATERRQV